MLGTAPLPRAVATLRGTTYTHFMPLIIVLQSWVQGLRYVINIKITSYCFLHLQYGISLKNKFLQIPLFTQTPSASE